MTERRGGREPPPIAAALAYARRGWPVFPCHEPAGDGCSCGDPTCASPAKHPRTRRGLHDASTRREVIERWWRRWPNANVAIRTGSPSGLVVVDVDPPHGGERSRRRLEAAHASLPATLSVRTGSGGLHLYFVHPGGAVRNTTGVLGAGLDVRADGGYVIAPPSVHASGTRYRWASVPRAAPLPDWLRTLLEPPERPRLPPEVERRNVRASAWASAALERELTAVAAAPEGQRNHTLNRAAFSLGQLVGAGHLDHGDVASLLEAAGRNAGLGAREVRATVASGLGAGQKSPRHPQDRRSSDRPGAAAPAEIDLRAVGLRVAAPPPETERSRGATVVDVAVPEVP